MICVARVRRDHTLHIPFRSRHTCTRTCSSCRPTAGWAGTLQRWCTGARRGWRGLGTSCLLFDVEAIELGCEDTSDFLLELSEW